ncbi:MAG TPA: lanthionine synthetase C family protein [Thermoanaerobaculia bacterium]|nr:lanthionine synthetase C family protein [Thermoanaerobaculia bacterium]
MTRNWHPILEGPAALPVSEAVHEIAAALPVAPFADDGRGASLAAGQAGQAVFHAYLALAENDEAQADRAVALLDGAVETLATTPLPPTLYTGFPGVAWVAEHLQGRLFEPGEDDPNLDVDEALLGALERSPWPGDYDLITGLAGLGVYALERLPRPTATACLERIVERLAERSERMPEGVTWFTPPERLPEWQREIHPNGYYNLGVAHGVPAVVALLAGAAAAGVAPARPLLDDTVRWLLAHRLEPGAGSCFGTSFYPGEDPGLSRLAWCYGDAGIAASLLAAARAVGEPAWEKEALGIALSAAERPAEKAMVRDAGLCHGAAGLGHLFNRMYQSTGEERLAEAARFWIGHALEIRQPGEGIAGFRVWTAEMDGDPPWRTEPGFLEGAAGIGLALLAAVSAVEPAWDRVLLVSLP